MPFTLFHFGAGALAKSIAPRHFSFASFAVSNVLIDLEPLVRMLGILDDTILHGPTHTFPGAVVIAALTLPSIRLWDRTAAALHLTSLRPPAVPTWMVLRSALIGTLSHVLLDAQMHADTASVRESLSMLIGAQHAPPPDMQRFCIELAVYALLIFLVRLIWRVGRKSLSRVEVDKRNELSRADVGAPAGNRTSRRKVASVDKAR